MEDRGGSDKALPGWRLHKSSPEEQRGVLPTKVRNRILKTVASGEIETWKSRTHRIKG